MPSASSADPYAIIAQASIRRPAQNAAAPSSTKTSNSPHRGSTINRNVSGSSAEAWPINDAPITPRCPSGLASRLLHAGETHTASPRVAARPIALACQARIPSISAAASTNAPTDQTVVEKLAAPGMPAQNTCVRVVGGSPRRVQWTTGQTRNTNPITSPGCSPITIVIHTVPNNAVPHHVSVASTRWYGTRTAITDPTISSASTCAASAHAGDSSDAATTGAR